MFSGEEEEEVKEVLKRSKLPKLLEQVKSTFPIYTKARQYANDALNRLAQWVVKWRSEVESELALYSPRFEVLTLNTKLK